ncbi:DUF6879 family protein [Streptomyces altiplanensis]
MRPADALLGPALGAENRLALVERTVALGVKVRRARVASEPVTEYIRFEHAITDANLCAGAFRSVWGLATEHADYRT